MVGLSKLVLPVTTLTKKMTKHDYKSSFQELKCRLTTTPILALPTPEKEYEVFCDVSNQGLGFDLMQERKIIAYVSRQLKLHEHNYLMHDLEFGVIVHTSKIWQHYLMGEKCSMFTEHKSLKYIFDQKEINLRRGIGWNSLKFMIAPSSTTLEE